MMEAEFRFEWELRGHGCAVCTVGDESTSVALTFGYLTDALADVLYGLQVLYRGGQDRFFFDEEPQELRWVVRRIDSDVRLTIYQFDDVGVSLDLPDSAGRVLWQSYQSRSSVVHAVTNEARRIRDEHGEQGYLAKWVRYPFPVNALLDLEQLHREVDLCPQNCPAGCLP